MWQKTPKDGRGTYEEDVKMNGKKWTEEELRILREKYPTQGTNINELDRSRKAIVNKAYKLGISVKERIPPNFKEVDLTPSPDLAYILGVEKSDGWIGKHTVGLTVSDEPFAESFRESLERLGVNTSSWIWRGYYFVVGYSTHLKKFCAEVESKDIEEKIESKEHTKEFLRGFYEGDGSVSVREGVTVEIYNSDRDLLEVVKEFVYRLGFESKIYPAARTERLYLLGGSSETLRFLNMIEPVIKFPNVDVGDIKNRRWTKREIRILKEKYPTQGTSISELKRTVRAIESRASRGGVKYEGWGWRRS